MKRNLILLAAWSLILLLLAHTAHGETPPTDQGVIKLSVTNPGNYHPHFWIQINAAPEDRGKVWIDLNGDKTLDPTDYAPDAVCYGDTIHFNLEENNTSQVINLDIYGAINMLMIGTYNCKLTVLDVTEGKALQDISIDRGVLWESQLSIACRDLPLLQRFNIMDYEHGNWLDAEEAEIEISNCPKLKIIDITDIKKLKKFTLSKLPALESLNAESLVAAESSIDLNESSKLNSFILGGVNHPLVLPTSSAILHFYLGENTYSKPPDFDRIKQSAISIKYEGPLGDALTFNSLPQLEWLTLKSTDDSPVAIQLKDCPKLANLSIFGNISALDLTGTDNVVELALEGQETNDISASFILPKQPKDLSVISLNNFNFGKNGVKLDLSSCLKLERINLLGEKTTIDLTLPTETRQIKELNVEAINNSTPLLISGDEDDTDWTNSIQCAITGSKLPKLTFKDINCSISIDVADLQEIDLEGVRANTVKIKKSTPKIEINKSSIIELSIQDSEIATLDLSSLSENQILSIVNCPNIKTITPTSNGEQRSNMNDITVSGCPSLTALDLSVYESLRKIECVENRNLTTLTLSKKQIMWNLAIYGNKLPYSQMLNITMNLPRGARFKPCHSTRTNEFCQGMLDYCKQHSITVTDENGQEPTGLPELYIAYYNAKPQNVEIPKAEILKQGDKLTKVAQPIYNNINGVWASSEDGSSPWDFDNGVMPKGNLPLYAHWSGKEFVKLTLRARHSEKTFYVEKNSPYTPEEPVELGSIFKGWNEDQNATTGVKSITLTEDKKYFAIWEEIEYTITIDMNDGSNTPTIIKATYNAGIQFYPEKVGYTPILVYQDDETKEAPLYPTSDLSLKVIWQPLFLYLNYEIDDLAGHLITQYEDPTPHTLDEIFTIKHLKPLNIPSNAAVTVTSWNDVSVLGLQLEKIVHMGPPPPWHETLFVKIASPITITYDSQGGSSITPQPMLAGDQIVFPAPPTKDGFLFAGWFTDAEGTQIFFDRQPMLNDLTLYAKWLPVDASKKPIVRFETKCSTPIAHVEVEKGNPVSQPTTELKKNFMAHVGWTLDPTSNIPYDFTQPVDHDILLYAVWKNKWQVDFFCLGATSNWPDRQEVIDGETIQYPLPQPVEKTGYTLIGWKRNGNESMFDPNTPIHRNMTLEPVWQKEKKAGDECTVTFHGPQDSYGYSNVIETQKVGLNAKIGALPTLPSTPNQRFVRWVYYAPSRTELLEGDVIAFDFDAFPEFITQSIVEFNTDGGSSIEPVSVDINTPMAQPSAPVKSGYDFKGWYPDPLFLQEYDFTQPVTKNHLLLYAKWERNATPIQSFKVTFIFQDNSTPDMTVTVNENDNVNEPTQPSRAGYKFLGWFKDAEGKTIFDFSTPITGELKLYACWHQIFTVTFHLQNDEPNVTLKIEEGKSITNAPIPTKPGYIFTGWFKDSQGNEIFDISAPVKANCDVYAVWIGIVKVTIMPQNGTPNIELFIPKGQKLSKPSDPTYQEHVFKGWFGDAAYSNPYNFDEPVNGDLTLYAKWEDDPSQTSPTTPPVATTKIELSAQNCKVAITKTADNTAIEPNSLIPQGTSIRIEVTPDDGYKFNSIMINGINYSENPFTHNVENENVCAIHAIVIKQNQPDPSNEGTPVQSEALAQVKAYPNPFTSHLYLENLTSCIEYALFNTMGHCVAKGKVTGERLTLTSRHLLPGLYILRLRAEDGSTRTLRLLKQ